MILSQPSSSPPPAALIAPAPTTTAIALPYIPAPSVLESTINSRAALEKLAQDTALLSAEQLAALSPEQLTARAVAHFVVCRDPDPELAKNLRAGLRLAKEQSGDEYLHSIAELYLLLPQPFITPTLTFAPPTQPLLDARRNSWCHFPIPGREYPIETRELFSELQGQLQLIPDLDELRTRAKALPALTLSPLTKKTLEREGVGSTPEIIERAELELRIIVHGINSSLEARQRHQLGKGITGKVAMETIFSYLNDTFKVVQHNQNYLSDGLATHSVDCDIYSKIFYEVGQQLGVPIEMLLIVGQQHNTGLGHCLPILVLERNQKGVPTHALLFETREPIPLPTGGTTRFYDSPAAIRLELNRRAGRELFGPLDKPFLGTEKILLGLIPDRETGLPPQPTK